MNNYNETHLKNNFIFLCITFIPSFFLNINALKNISNANSFPFEAYSDILSFSSFGCLIVLFSLWGMPKKNDFSKNDFLDGKHKAFPYLILAILFFIYIPISAIIFKHPLQLHSSLIMCFSVFSFYLFKRTIFSVEKTKEYQRNWQKRQAGVEINSSNGNIFWRMKIWFFPRVKLQYHRKPKPNLFMFIFYCLFLRSSLNITSPLIFFINIAFFLYGFFYALEFFFNLYTETLGYCLNIDYTPSKNTDIWTVTVIDYEHKRILHFKTRQNPYYSNGDYVRVVSGMFTKKVVTSSRHSKTTY